MTDDEFKAVGAKCRGADDGNLLTGSFAAELVGESYPFSKAMSSIVFKTYSDIELGKKFAAWMESQP